MRVISGAAKGRQLRTVQGREIRPTADRVRESLFNILAPRVVEADFLDLFAGSGAVGIEALSRGARSCVFVELVTSHLAVVAANLKATGLIDKADLLRRDARAAVRDLARRGRRFHLIFIDPPYAQGLAAEALQAIAAEGLLGTGGWAICEHHRKDALPEQFPGSAIAGGLHKFRELVFGETVLSLYRESNPNGGQMG